MSEYQDKTVNRIIREMTAMDDNEKWHDLRHEMSHIVDMYITEPHTVIILVAKPILKHTINKIRRN